MNKLEQAARQALDALVKCNHFHDYEDEITALREALAEQAEQEPVGYWQGKFSQDGGAALYEVPQASAFGYHYPNYPVYAAPQPDYKALWEQMCKRCDELDLELAKYTEQEPVAWGWATADGEIVDCICPAQHDITEGYYTIPLYTQPIRTKDLTDAEIADALYGKGCWRLGVHPVHLREYRRVIQADRGVKQMTDRELLELAAKAAGIEIATWSNCNAGGFTSVGKPYLDSWGDERTNGKFWNPLTDDGDALRLVVKLGLHIECNTKVLGDTLVSTPTTDVLEIHNDDPYAATRRAIVRSAAAIVGTMK